MRCPCCGAMLIRFPSLVSCPRCGWRDVKKDRA